MTQIKDVWVLIIKPFLCRFKTKAVTKEASLMYIGLNRMAIPPDPKHCVSITVSLY